MGSTSLPSTCYILSDTSFYLLHTFRLPSDKITDFGVYLMGSETLLGATGLCSLWVLYGVGNSSPYILYGVGNVSFYIYLMGSEMLPSTFMGSETLPYAYILSDETSIPIAFI